MKIAIIRRRYTEYGGAEIFIERLTQQMALDGPSIISTEWNTKDKNINFIQAKDSGLSRKSRLVKFNQSVSKILKAKKFDIIQSHERMLGVDIFRAGDGVHASWLDKLSSESSFIKNFWLRHDGYHQEVLRLEKLMAQDSRIQFVANSSMTKNDLINYLNVPQNRIFTIKNGFDNSEIIPASLEEKIKSKINLGLNPDCPHILFVGSGFERKGAFFLAEAAKLLPNIQISIVGKDKKLSLLEKYINSQKLESRVFIRGPQKNINQYYESADVFCLPSLYDSFSNAVLEALAYGIPCVLTQNVGMHDAVSSFLAGHNCIRNPESIASAIDKTLGSIDQLSINARSLSNQYATNQPMTQWANLYKHVMDSKQS
jgi:UDP-glucose:(heptosyl)LPS alpha-1,3-glucosyltransferase